MFKKSSAKLIPKNGYLINSMDIQLTSEYEEIFHQPEEIDF